MAIRPEFGVADFKMYFVHRGRNAIEVPFARRVGLEIRPHRQLALNGAPFFKFNRRTNFHACNWASLAIDYYPADRPAGFQFGSELLWQRPRIFFRRPASDVGAKSRHLDE